MFALIDVTTVAPARAHTREPSISVPAAIRAAGPVLAPRKRLQVRSIAVVAALQACGEAVSDGFLDAPGLPRGLSIGGHFGA
jgi:hypothetical protein